jgi:N-acylneuraminate cytidylyltransferase
MVAGAVAIIPARGGSTRIPRKNIKEFNGRPILEWPVTACLSVEGISQVVVSTEDEGIGGVARSVGATVVERPEHLATNTAGTAPVIAHAIDELGLEDTTIVLCLYPTATLTATQLSEVLGLAAARPESFVVTVGRHRSPWERSLHWVSDGLMSLASPDHLLTRTQDLPQRFFDAGKVYAASASLWRQRETMMEHPFVPFFLPEWATVDIDEPEDWPVAEALHRVFVLEAS